ncbi:MAG: bifunctional phosphoribosylaminoimidazolecarboxamide formyltransferase/IMP cyclohydrolase [Bacteroidales bacterium]|nr:bifunctional phosphoribosylaminoimidazolecarboxamide formyltransferase/IMP cyclohydrolase [Bacteroidales bacterium]MDD4602402.1 bifunctional phosphoribosylaminoimidazolecarboxamide formyltransferase/IMP cyclohydrolase [Bacteroidales bacterium]
MIDQIKIKSALISVFSKDWIEPLARKLESFGIHIYSTGGTFEFLKSKGIQVTSVESVTAYPSILGGRVKTLHPKIFGGILWRRDQLSDLGDVEKYDISSFDLVVVDLYPFEKTITATENEEEIIEKIDIGGISLIRAAAKNFKHVMVIPSSDHFLQFLEMIEKNKGFTTLEERRLFAAHAFNVSSHYDTVIFNYFNRKEKIPAFKQSILLSSPLRYGENPHQKGIYYGDLHKIFNQLHGKEISYNNLVDVDAAVNLIREFSTPTVAIIKHTNPCGVASRFSLTEAYKMAFACDPISAYGGVIIANGKIEMETAEALNLQFFEVLIAEDFENDALELLKSKKNRIILHKNSDEFSGLQFKSVLNGALVQEKDFITDKEIDFHFVTIKKPGPEETKELIFANKIVKHLKSNTISIVKDQQLIGCGMGQTSRVDALRQAILKAKTFGFDVAGAVMASDAYLPFADCVEIAHEAGITAVLQPGGSIRDADSINYCNEHSLSMIFTGIRHFKH